MAALKFYYWLKIKITTSCVSLPWDPGGWAASLDGQHEIPGDTSSQEGCTPGLY